jgi:hypothetical protein
MRRLDVISNTPKFERLYNAVSPVTARKLARALKRRGYQVKRRQQWVAVSAGSLDVTPGQIARRYGAIAY